MQTNVKGILGVFRSFYRKLYARSNNYALKQDEIVSVTEGRARPKVETSSLFKKDLLQGTMGEFNNNKTPGLMLYLLNSIRSLPLTIIDIWIDVFNEVMVSNVEPLSTQCAVTVLLPKGGDPQQPSTDRPITFINTDFDIIA